MTGIFHLKCNHPIKLYLTENFSNCRDVAQAGFIESGIFSITLPGKFLTSVWMWLIRLESRVYCDLETDGGGWLVSVICVLPYCKSKIKIKIKA